MIKSAYYLQLEKPRRGSYLFNIGESPKAFYGIIKGKVSLLKSTKVDESIRARHLEVYQLLTEGKCFGEEEIILNAPRKFTARAEEDCVLFKLDKNGFNQCFKVYY